MKKDGDRHKKLSLYYYFYSFLKYFSIRFIQYLLSKPPATSVKNTDEFHFFFKSSPKDRHTWPDIDCDNLGKVFVFNQVLKTDNNLRRLLFMTRVHGMCF